MIALSRFHAVSACMERERYHPFLVEDALRRSEAGFQQLGSHTSVPLAMVDYAHDMSGRPPSGTLIKVSRCTSRSSG